MDKIYTLTLKASVGVEFFFLVRGTLRKLLLAGGASIIKPLANVARGALPTDQPAPIRICHPKHFGGPLKR